MLVLASASPRRRELLLQAGLEFTVDAAEIPEVPGPGEEAAEFVLRLAEEKAQAVWAKLVSRQTEVIELKGDPLVVLGADTCVLCQGEILGKPRDQADARRMLEMLSGRTHQVLTGLAAVTATETFADVEITQVTFNVIEEEELVRYLASAEPLDKAGAYGIQGYAARWVPRIEGDYFNIVGLPIARTVSLLAEAFQAAAADDDAE
jgi:septum formation protein